VDKALIKQAFIKLRYLQPDRVGRLLHAHVFRRLAHIRPGRAVVVAPTLSLTWQRGCFLECSEAMTLGWLPCLAGTADVTIRKADDILAGQVKLFPGYQIETSNGNIPWHLGPKLDGTWAEWPQSYWPDIDIMRAELDPKVTWELNRCQHLQVLGRAYRLSQDERYAAEAARQVRHWIEHNPFEVGINWRSALEVAIRAMSWAWTTDLCTPSPAWASGDMQRLLSASLQQHAQHVYRYLEWHPRPDTHALGEALALILLGIGFGQRGSANLWLRRGLRTLSECARCQLTNEGVYYEGNLQYHAYALEYYLQAAVLVRRYSLEIAVDLDAVLRKVLEATTWLAGPTGVLPEIGDDDGGRGSALDNRWGGRDVRPLVALAAAYLGVPAKIPLQDGDWELATWLLGQPATRTQQTHTEGTSKQSHSAFLPEAGYAVQRAGQRTLWLRCGRLGVPPYAGHGHADLLHVVIQTENGLQLPDAGTYTYNGDQRWRWYFRSTVAHNVLVVDGASQAYPHGRFAWQAIPRCRNTAWLSHPVFDWASAEHTAYQSLVHWRGVLFVRPEYWLIFDQLTGSGAPDAALLYHFPVDSLVDIAGDGIRSSSGLSLTVLTAGAGGEHDNTGEWSKIEGWASPGYGLRVATPTVQYKWRGGLPLRTVTLIYPDARARLKCARADVQASSDVLAWSIRTIEGEDLLLWNVGQPGCSVGQVELQEGIAFWHSSAKALFLYQPQSATKACVVKNVLRPLCTALV